jgi:hypothetical protein
MNHTEELHRITRDIAILSSKVFSGRLSGTSGAFHAAKFLAQSLQDMGIQEKGSDGYFSPVKKKVGQCVELEAIQKMEIKVVILC